MLGAGHRRVIPPPRSRAAGSGRGDSVTVISPRPDYNWVPSNIWVGVGLMKPSKVTFPLAPIYERAGIEFVQAAAREIYPEGDEHDSTPYVTAAVRRRDARPRFATSS